MSNVRLGRPSPALVIACIALFVALGGTGYAAITLKKNSVAAKHLKRNAVTSPKIKDATIATNDLAPATQQALRGQQGERGEKGEKGDPCLASDPACRGPQGPAGPGARWAFVDGNGTILAQSGGISVNRTGTGNYYLDFGSDVSGKTIHATPAYRTTDAGNGVSAIVALCGGGTCGAPGTDDTNHVFVGTFDSTGALNDQAHYVSVF